MYSTVATAFSQRQCDACSLRPTRIPSDQLYAASAVILRRRRRAQLQCFGKRRLLAACIRTALTESGEQLTSKLQQTTSERIARIGSAAGGNSQRAAIEGSRLGCGTLAIGQLKAAQSGVRMSMDLTFKSLMKGRESTPVRSLGHPRRLCPCASSLCPCLCPSFPLLRRNFPTPTSFCVSCTVIRF